MLQTFLPLFFMTFGICLFIVLMQFLWRYIDDMVGKGLGMAVLGEMFFYAALFLVPMALPLAILLASLMTFGNLGERLELLAMKSAGVSLVHIMRPLIVTLCLVSVGAFYFQNNVMPVVQVKLYTLLYSMRQKSPELDIPEGVFYKEITGFNVYVKKKDNQTGLLKDLMIYDYSEGFNNARVIVADSGRLKTSEDKLFLVLSLFNGESFENLRSQTGTAQTKVAVPYRRESFSTKDILIEFDANFTRTDESFMQNQYMGKNLKDLQASIDSMTVRLDSIKNINARGIYDLSYRKSLNKRRHDPETENRNAEKRRARLRAEAKTAERKGYGTDTQLDTAEATTAAAGKDTSSGQNTSSGQDTSIRYAGTSQGIPGHRTTPPTPNNKLTKPAGTHHSPGSPAAGKKGVANQNGAADVPDAPDAGAPTIVMNFDSLYRAQPPSGKAALLARAKLSVENIRTDYYFRAATVGDEAYKVRRHLTEWHKKFTLSFACLVFFFIGAPLGAIIRKGGLGMPVIISVILFIFYYIVDNIGFKMARDGVWEAWQGMWLSSVVLAPLGVFLTYKAVNDSVILNADTYLNALKNLIGKRSGRKIEKKEVIIYTPDYAALAPRLAALADDAKTYLANHRRWINYLSYWKQGGRDRTAERIAVEMENIVEELANSDQNLVLNKLMDYPVIGGYTPLGARLNGKTGLAIGLFLPFGIPLYLLATYQRKLLRHDIRMVQKTSQELLDMMEK